jgi:hypothetical protein
VVRSQTQAGQEDALAPLRGSAHNAGPETPQANWRALLRHLVRDAASGTERRRLDYDNVQSGRRVPACDSTGVRTAGTRLKSIRSMIKGASHLA